MKTATKVLKFLILFVFIAFLSALSGALFSSYTKFISDSDNAKQSFFIVEKGKDLRNISRQLEKEGFITDASNFAFWSRVYGNASKVRAGEFAIPPYASPEIIMKIITSSETVVRKVTLNEGLTSSQMLDLLNSAYGLVGSVEVPANGTLLPNTYYYSLNDTKESIINKMKKNMEKKSEELWKNRKEGLPLKNVKEAIILASIVEREATLAEERPLIASVFINRLRKKMRLQSDPTVIYAITNGTYDLNRRVLYKDLRFESPFNTYVKYGLPPSAICNPGLDSIRAVLNPADTDYLYFVADNKGGHIFSNNYRTHTNQVNKMRKKNARKAKAKSTSSKATTTKQSTKENSQPSSTPKRKEVPAPLEVKPAPKTSAN